MGILYIENANIHVEIDNNNKIVQFWLTFNAEEPARVAIDTNSNIFKKIQSNICNELLIENIA